MNVAELEVAERVACEIGRVEAPGDLVLMTLVGSHAQGTATEESDFDFKGCYVAPLERVLSLYQKTETAVDRKEPDVVIYELGHLRRLASSGNPTVLEVLWGPVVHQSTIGRELRSRRRMFLGARDLCNAYGGYAYAQLQKARAETGGSRGATHHQRQKFRMHTLRLAEPERLRADADRGLDWIEGRVKDLMGEMGRLALTTSLPEYAPREPIDEFIYRARMS